MMSDKNHLRGPDYVEEDGNSTTDDCSNRDSESRDQPTHRNSSAEPHRKPEKYPRQLGKEGEQNRSVEYSSKLSRYLSVWLNGQEQPFRQKVDEMIEYIRNNPGSISLVTNTNDQNSPSFSSKDPKLITEDKDSKPEKNTSNVQNMNLVFPGVSPATCHSYRSESYEGKSRYSTFEPAVTIGCSNEGPQVLSFAPSVDPLPILQPTFLETESNLKTLFDDAIAFPGPSRFSCNKCQKEFEYEYDFMNHSCKLNREDQQYSCNYCYKSFKNKGHLDRHSLIHTGEKPHCGKSFSSKCNLKRHHEGYGSADKKYECKECYKKYRKKQDPDTHYRKHTGEQPFECVECGKSFSDSYSFSRHKESCADDRPYACVNCNKKFILKCNLDRHSLIHSVEKLYECMRCGKKFSTKSYLGGHEKSCGCSLQDWLCHIYSFTSKKR